MKTSELRETYLDFFRSKAHKVFPSDSLVPYDDPSLLFTGAGMNQFKPYFLGIKKDVKRAASCQKCLRTGDLDRVGKTAYHHTFFEMLGNFSFGDYFKEQAIDWGWEFVTKVLKLPAAKLWVSVYEKDDEAFNIWKNKMGLPASRIVRMGPEDNFWPANAPKDGPNGPCGPCSEIYVGEIPGKGVEIWNLVFTQFDRQSDGSLVPLPQKNIDTGMGLERTACVLQGKESNFDNDMFSAIRAELWHLLKKGGEKPAHENAAMDHIRAVVFTVSEGVSPSNEGRGYVTRRLIRLGSEHLDKAGAAKPGQLYKLVPAIVAVMKDAYPELVSKEKDILKVVENEVGAYREVLRVQIPKLEQSFEHARKDNTAEIAFKFYDTYGLPIDLITEAASKKGLTLDAGEFNKLMEGQRQRSRQGSKIAGEIFAKDENLVLVEGLSATEFVGYQGTEAKGRLLAIIRGGAKVNDLKKDEEGLLIFDKSPFYAESGGQVGDTGFVKTANDEALVSDTQRLEKYTLHHARVTKGSLKAGDEAQLLVDKERRADIMKNHTATHLLHAALRKVLGAHVKQSGSLVAPDRLRFDFTHFSGVGSDALVKIESMVNDEIMKDTTLDKKEMSKEDALKAGAMAFFGEKYGESVRVVTVGDFSMELCGGTHLAHTGEIGAFKIISESSIQAGVRRIEAVTGRGAKSLLDEGQKELETLARSFGSEPARLAEVLKNKQDKAESIESRLNTVMVNKMKTWAKKEISSALVGKGPYFLVRELPFASPDLMRSACDDLAKSGVSFAALLVSVSDDKVSFAVAASADLVKKGFHAGKIVKEIAGMVEGNGGGKPDFAVGGGKNISKTKDAIEKGRKLISESH